MLSVESIINITIFIYAFLLIGVFLLFALISSVELKKYLKKNKYVTYKELLVSAHVPPITVIAPVLNAQNAIVNQVRALLALQYNNFDIIVVNDGSTDNTFRNLQTFFQLEIVDFAVHTQIKTREIHGYYKSKNPAFSKLTVIDKVHGGKADALNAGINTSGKDFILCLERDCFFHKNLLLKLIKPFLEEVKPVIGVGAVVQVANSCEKVNGSIVKINFPRMIWPGFLAIEYFKSFLVERLSWSRLNGIHEVSGGVNLFNKEILIRSGGYNSKTLKTGFELVVRMCRYMHDNGLEYQFVYLPDTLCWIESPCDLVALSRQRKNFAAGNFQIFRLNKDLFFNPKYGMLGLINFPFWFFKEWITPFFKLLALISLFLLAVLGKLNWEFTAILLLMLYFFAVMLSLISLIFKEKSYQASPYKELTRIVLLIFLEPLVYHPLVTYWKITAYLGGKSWSLSHEK